MDIIENSRSIMNSTSGYEPLSVGLIPAENTMVIVV
jgi:hypothetical protein